MRMAVATVGLMLLTGCGACVDLEAPRPYPCSRDAGSDDAQCPSGWTCGLEGACHAKDVPAEYLCTSDTDCVGERWRCGPEGRCVNAELDALEPTPSAATYRVRRLGPDLLDGQPEHLAVSDDFRVIDVCGQDHPETAALSWTRDGGLTKVVLAKYPMVVLDGGFPDGGSYCNEESYRLPPQAITLQESASVTLPAPVVALAENGTRTFVALSTGALCIYDWRVKQGMTGSCQSNFFGFLPTELRLSDDPPVLLAFNNAQVAAYNISSGIKAPPRAIPGVDGGTTQIHDFILVGDTRDAYAYAATSRGLYVANYTNGLFTPFGAGTMANPFGPAQLHTTTCDGIEAPRATPLRLQTTENEDALIGTVVDEKGERGFFLLRTMAGSPGGSCPYPPASPSSAYVMGTSFGSDNDCEGSKPESVHIVQHFNSPSYYVRAEVRCAAVAGRQEVLQYNLPSGQDLTRVEPLLAPFYTLPTLGQRSNPRRHAQADALGHIWWSREDVGVNLALFLDRVPLTLVRGPEDWVMRLAAQVAGIGADANKPILKDTTFVAWAGSPPTAVDKGDVQFPLLSNVQGAPAWAVMELFDEKQLPPFVGNFSDNLLPVPTRANARFPQSLTPPTRAVLATRGDGTRLLLVSSFDALYAVVPEDTVIETLAQFAGLPEAVVRLVPLPRGAITSLVALPPLPMAAPASVQGYVLAASRLFHFEARSAAVWRADEVLLPEGDPIKVFSDGKSGRVGMADGRVFGLPSRAQIAPSLPSSAVRASGFAQVCAQIYALTREGLYRLQSTAGAPQGSWTRLPAQDAWLSAGGVALDEGILEAAGDQLLVVSPSGRAVQVDGLGCP